MYTDENSEKEIERDNNHLNDIPKVTSKSLSTVGIRNNPESQARPLTIRATQSFAGALEELRLTDHLQKLNAKSTPATCPCGCLLRPTTIGPFRTREQNTLALHVVGPEVLNYHNNNYDPSHIAMFWKKDCRMFLWKGKAKMKNVIRADSYKKIFF